MKKIFSTAILFILAFNCHAQTFPWAEGGYAAGGWGEGMMVATDANSNAVIVGYYSSPSIIFGTYTLTNAGVYNIYVTKYDPNGNVLWTQNAGGSGGDVANGVCTDVNGNIFVTGSFSSPSIVFGTYTLTNAGGGGDIFLVKYDPNGNVLWVRTAVGTNDDCGNSVCTDALGNVFLTGRFASPTLALGTNTVTNAGGNDAIFTAKYDTNGNPLWVQGTGGASGDEGYSVSADPSGNIFVTGYFGSPSVAFGTYTLTNASGDDVFLTKYDTNGNALWAKSAGGGFFDYAYSASADASGNVYITGEYSAPNIIFGTNTLTTGGGTSAMFFVKYDPSGNVLWAKKAGGINNDVGYSVSTYTNGVFVTGSLTSPTITFGTYTLTRPAGFFEPMFVVEYDLAGNVVCAKVLTSGGDDNNAVCADQYGNAYITGDFLVNPFVVGSNTLTLAGTEDIFITKFNCQPDVGIKINENNSSSKIFPNPTSSTVILSASEESASIEVYNVLGKLIITTTLENGKAEIDLSQHASGIYFVKIGSVTKKIIKE